MIGFDGSSLAYKIILSNLSNSLSDVFSISKYSFIFFINESISYESSVGLKSSILESVIEEKQRSKKFFKISKGFYECSILF